MEALNNKSLDDLRDGIYSNSYDNGINKTKVRTKSRSKINVCKLKKYLTLSSSMFTLILIIYMVLGYTEMVAINSNNKLIQYENENLQLTIDELEIKLKPFANKERIEKIASSRLQMIYPKSTNIVKITDKPYKEDKEFVKKGLEKARDKSLLSYVNDLIR